MASPVSLVHKAYWKDTLEKTTDVVEDRGDVIEEKTTVDDFLNAPLSLPSSTSAEEPSPTSEENSKSTYLKRRIDIKPCRKFKSTAYDPSSDPNVEVHKIKEIY
jgi:hypothetical protein